MAGFTSSKSWLHTLLYRRRRSGLITAASLLVASEAQALSMVLASNTPSIQIKDTGTPANYYHSQGRVAGGALIGPGGKLTYSSPSPKMCLQSDGIFKFQAHNLFTNSATFATTWTTAGNVLYNSATTLNGFSYNVYVYARKAPSAANSTLGAYRWNGAGPTGLDANSGTFTVTSESWTRFTIPLTGTAADGGFFIPGGAAITKSNVSDATAPFGDQVIRVQATGVDVYLQAPQLSRAPANSDYISTTSAAKYDLPYEWDILGAPQGLRIEEARIGLAYPSDASSGYSLANLSNTAASITLTDGTTGGRIVTDNGVSTTHSMYNLAAAGALSSATNYVITGIFKASVRYPILCLQGSANNFASAVFDVANVNATSASQTGVGATSGTIVATYQKKLPNNWVECTLVAQVATSCSLMLGVTSATTGNTFATNGLVSYTGDGSGYYMEYLQVTAGSCPTSRINTTTSTVTRVMDNIYLATTAYPHSATVNSLIAEVVHSYNAASVWPGFLSVYNTSTSNGFHIGTNPSPYAKAFMNDTTAQADLSSSNLITLGASSKIAAAFAANDVAISLGGSAATTDTVATIPTSLNRMMFGSYQGVAALSFHVKTAVIVPRRLSNAELQAVTV